MSQKPTFRSTGGPIVWLLTRLAVVVAVASLAAACGSDDATEDAEASTGAAAADDTGDGDSDAADSDTDDSGSDDSGSDAAGDGGSTEENYYPVTVSTEMGDVVVEAQPVSIVSISPTSTEMLFAIGAGDRVAAVDFFSNYPPEAPEGTLDGFAPDLEALLGAEPDLLISSGLPDDIMAGLEAAGVPVITQTAATSLDGVYDQIAQLGEATGNLDQAAQVNADMRAAIDDLLADLPAPDEPVRVFHEIDDSFYSATSATFIGQVYSEMGFENVADPYDDGGGYPLIDGETIIDANPTMIVLPISEYSTYGSADIASRPGWDSVDAVLNDRIIEVDADIASRWGPRIVEFMEAVAALVPAPS